MVHKAPYDAKHGKELKILTPKQILQRLLLALAWGKAGNTSENLLNDILNHIFFLSSKNKLLKKYIII